VTHWLAPFRQALAVAGLSLGERPHGQRVGGDAAAVGGDRAALMAMLLEAGLPGHGLAADGKAAGQRQGFAVQVAVAPAASESVEESAVSTGGVPP
jgi:hypothetical protein